MRGVRAEAWHEEPSAGRTRTRSRRTDPDRADARLRRWRSLDRWATAATGAGGRAPRLPSETAQAAPDTEDANEPRSGQELSPGARRALRRDPGRRRSCRTPKQPRQVFDDEALEELKISIQEVGFLQPIVVRELGGGPVRARHGRAALAGRPGARPGRPSRRSSGTPATTRCSGTRCWRTSTARNLNPLEEAAAYQQLLEEFGATHEELARRIGRSRPQISNTIRLLNLPAPGAAPGRRRRAVGRTRPGAARPGGRRGAGGAGDPHRRRRAVGPGDRGARLAGARRRRRRSRPAAKRRAKPHAPALVDLADRLSDRFDTRVKVDIGRQQGQDHDRVRDGGRPGADRRHHRRAGPEAGRRRLTALSRRHGRGPEGGVRGRFT